MFLLLSVRSDLILSPGFVGKRMQNDAIAEREPDGRGRQRARTEEIKQKTTTVSILFSLVIHEFIAPIVSNEFY